jgi:Tfp pilus assembly pilus retraction ATPase PilT
MACYSLNELLQTLDDGEAIHLHPGEAPVFEMSGMLFRAGGPPMANEDTEDILRRIAPENELAQFKTNKLASFSHTFSGYGTFQVMVFKEHNLTRLELRKLVCKT